MKLRKSLKASDVAENLQLC